MATTGYRSVRTDISAILTTSKTYSTKTLGASTVAVTHLRKQAMTPEQAYNLLSKVFNITKIRKSSQAGAVDIVCPASVGLHDLSFYEKRLIEPIEWGDATEYRPTTWRPATAEDAIRAMKGETILCRVRQTSDMGWVWDGVQLVTFVRGINMPWYVSVGSDVLRYQICEVQE